MGTDVLLRIVTPERIVYEDRVDMVIARGLEGDLGILFDHKPMVTPLKIGVLKIKKGKKFHPVAISGGGVLEIKTDLITVLADAAELPEEIDVERARAARKKAEDLLARGEDSDVDWARAQAALRRSMARLTTVEEYYKH